MTTPVSRTIEDAITRLWFDIDHHDGASAHLFFTEDAHLTFDARRFTGRVAIAQVYADRKARGPRLSRHLVSNLMIDRIDDDAVRSHHVCVLHAVDGTAPGPTTVPAAVADVEDVLTRSVDGQAWLLAERTWRTVFIAPETELAVPTR